MHSLACNTAQKICQGMALLLALFPAWELTPFKAACCIVYYLPPPPPAQAPVIPSGDWG